jgi:beta-N-acetylhexosaminidase
MLAHVRLRELDAIKPASFSTAVIDGLIRTEWKHDGLLITDDFSMGAVTRSKEGIGGAAVAALKAGADLILVSFSDKHLNTVLSALIDADKTGGLDSPTGAASIRRLTNVPAAHPPIPLPEKKPAVPAGYSAVPAAKTAVP